jgi:hypothetical protein
MSPEEKREQKARTLLEYQETQEEIAALEVKAKRMGAEISKFGEWMQRSPATHIYRREQEQYGLRVEFTPPEILETIKNWERSFELADELRQATPTIARLRRREKTTSSHLITPDARIPNDLYPMRNCRLAEALHTGGAPVQGKFCGSCGTAAR